MSQLGDEGSPTTTDVQPPPPPETTFEEGTTGKKMKDEEEELKANIEREAAEKAAKELEEREKTLLIERSQSNSPSPLDLSMSSPKEDATAQKENSEKILGLLRESFDLVEAAVQLDSSHNYGNITMLVVIFVIFIIVMILSQSHYLFCHCTKLLRLIITTWPS